MSKAKEESLYKILGTTAKISNKRIKEKYIQAVRNHPPETDPEGFEKVRYAYDILKNPEQREQYDMERKYGSSLQGLLDKASYEMNRENYGKAEQILKKAEQINDRSVQVLSSLAVIAAEKGDVQTVGYYLAEVETNSDNKSGQISLYRKVISELMENELVDDAAYYVKEAMKNIPGDTNVFIPFFCDLLLYHDESERAWDFVSQEMVAPEEANDEGLKLLHVWIMVTKFSGKWSGVSKINAWFKRYISNQTQEMKEEAATFLEEEMDELYDHADFQMAHIYATLLKITGIPMSKELKAQIKEINELERIQKQIDRAGLDEQLFPMIYLNLYRWFYGQYLSYQDIEMAVQDILPPSFRSMLEEYKEDYAAGIVRLRKKYPILYKYFKENWDELFAELTKGFNREMKRSLK